MKHLPFIFLFFFLSIGFAYGQDERNFYNRSGDTITKKVMFNNQLGNLRRCWSPDQQQTV